MANQLNEKSITQLKQFVTFIKSNSDILHAPELSFFKDYLLSLGATIPPKKQQHVEEVSDDTPEPPHKKPHVGEEPKKEKPEHKPEHKPEYKPEKPEKHEKPEEKPEPVPEEPEVIDDPDLLPPDEDYESIEMGDPNKEVTDEADGDSFSLLAEGRKAARENNHELAIQKITEAIKLNPKSSVLFATRAESFLNLKRPNAAVKDCNRALELNPDSGKALKTRGKARRFLGKYVEANYDLNQGNLLDWDENTDKMIKEIKERAENALQKQRKEQEKKRLEDLKREAAEKRRKQQEEEDRRRKEESYDFGEEMGGMPGMGGMGGMPGMGGMGGMAGIFDHLLKDPEVAALVKDPKVSSKFMEHILSQGQKHADDPDVQKVVNLLMKKSGVGFGGAGKPTPPTGSSGADDDLD